MDEPENTDQLTPKERKFVAEYAVELNGTQAYLRAFPGAAYTTARNGAKDLLAKPYIKAEIDAAKDEHRKTCNVRARRVLDEIVGIAHSDPADIWEEGPDGKPQLRAWSTIPPAARKTIQSIEIKRKRLKGGDDVTEWEIEDVKVKQHSKDSALDKLCKHLGLTKDGAALEKLLELLREDGGNRARTEPSSSPPGQARCGDATGQPES